MKKNLIILSIIGLLFRIGISIYDSYGDINIYYNPWVRNISKLGYSDFYSREKTANYPPLTMYLFKYSFDVGNNLSKPIMQSLIYVNNNVGVFPSKLVLFINEHKILNSFIKLPFMIADLFLAIGVYQLATLIIKKKGSIISLLLFISVLFNPAFFYNSSLWGQVDVLPIMFAVWSFYFLFKEKIVSSAIFFTLALLSKQTIGVLLPIYFLIYLKYANWKNIIWSITFSSVLFFLFFLPFYKEGNIFIFPFIQYVKLATTFGGNALSAHAYNFWWLITNKAHLPDTTTFFFLSASIWSKIFLGVLCITVLIPLIKIKKNKYFMFFAAATVLSMGIFLFSTRMHERHFLPTIPFLLLMTIQNLSIYKLFILFSIFHFFNLYSAWGQPYFVFMWDLSNNKTVANIMILLQIIIFFYLLFFYINFSVFKKIKYQKQNNTQR